ncbi:DNA-processing protein DprA [Kutzneria viridogrisea]|uniref:DNA processing protein n=1 Tax=Kutzneria viridogrisea TaxID=47990 RepID=A0ABR6BG36_9PSEU|nr:DNA processing protein [Kutzneria viridogrisea]
MKTDPVRLARAYLLRVAEPPAPSLVALINEEGPVRAAELVRRGAVAEETAARCHLDLAEQDLARADARGARLLTPEDPDWPGWQLLSLRAARTRGVPGMVEPIALWFKGSMPLNELVDRAVAVVGARAATGYGDHVANEFGFGLAERQVAVVSGAAYGVDGAAHRGALAAGWTTLAVLGCGVDVGYPVRHTDLLQRIAEHGAVVSEYPPGTPPARHRFLVRNRLIAALGAGTVVVEAGRRSGARNTASTAHSLGKPVMAVPGPITSAMSVGCHDLLRSGVAAPVCSVDEVVEAIGRIGTDLAPREPGPQRPTDGLDPVVLRVHEALSTGLGLSPDQVSVESGVPLDRVRAALPQLELAGLAVRKDTGWCAALGRMGTSSSSRCGGA